MAPVILDDSELMLPPSFRRRRYHRETTTIETAPSYHSSSMPHPYSRRDREYEREYEPAPITPPRSPVILHEDRIHKETIIPRDALPPGVAIVSRDEVIGSRRGKSEKSYHREGGSRSEIGSVRDERMSIRDEREREYSMSGAYREPPNDLDYERERPVDYRDVPAHPDGDRVYFDYRHNREGEEPHRIIESGVGTRHHRLSGNFVSEEEHHHRRRALAEAAGGLGAAGLGAGAIGRTVRRGRGERREYRDGHDSRGSSRSTSSSPDRHRGKKIAAGVVGAGAALGLAAAAAHHMRSKSRDGSVYSSDELDEDGKVIGRGRRGSRSGSRHRSRSRAKKLVAATALGAGIAAARHRRHSRSRASSVSSNSDAGSRSGSRHRGRKLAAAAAATSAGIAGVNYIRKRSKSRGAGSRSSSTSSFTSSDDERHPSHKGRKVAAAALGAAAAGAALKHHHNKKEGEKEDMQRGRSRSRSQDRGPKSILRKVRSLSMGGRPRRRSGSVSSYTSDDSYSSDDSRRSRRSRRKPVKQRQSTAAAIGKGIAVGVAARALKNAFENHERRKYEYDSDDSRSSRRSHRSSRKTRPGMGRRIRSRSLGGGGNVGWAGKIATGVAASALEHIVDATNKGGRRRR